jgi:hypothetical protein
VSFRTLAVSGALVVGTTACSGPTSSSSVVQSERAAVIYDADDRVEVFESEPTVRALAARTVAVGRRGNLSFDEAGSALVTAPSWMEAAGLCPGQRFAMQPAFALCTGLLVGHDLALTAAHCVATGDPLSDLVVVEGFRYESEDALPSIRRGHVHEILEIVAQDPNIDVAWLRLSQPLAEPAPWNPVPAPPAVDEPVLGINHGGGIPAKVDAGGRVIEIDGGAVFVDLDAFGGASGGPVFSWDGALVGILTAGMPDYELSERNCLTYLRTSGVPGLAGELAIGPDEARAVLCERVSDAPPCSGSIEREWSAPPGGCSVAFRQHGRGSWAVLFAAAWMATRGRRFRVTPLNRERLRRSPSRLPSPARPRRPSRPCRRRRAS